MKGVPRIYHHQIETPLPLRAQEGAIEITGWCLAEGSTRPPKVKLVSESSELSAIDRISRPDVSAAFRVATETPLWGFHLRGALPAGAHLLTLVAASDDGLDWQPLQRFTVSVLSRGLQAAIEFPRALALHESVRIQGWCAHPELPLREVWLHYGTRRTRCVFGLPRLDVLPLLPSAPDATRAGFISAKNSVAGRGALRVVAVDALGTRHVARTDRWVDINVDEENPAGLNLPPQLARVSPACRAKAQEPELPEAPERRLRVLFVLYGDFTSNSAIHVAALANAMTALGHACVVAVAQHPETVSRLHGAQFRAVSFAAAGEHAAVFAGNDIPDIVHAWTTRENVRRFCEPLCAATGAKLVVHLEDNEQRLLEMALDRSSDELLLLTNAELDELIAPECSHPRRGPEFLRSAQGVSVILSKLGEQVPPGMPIQTFWPAADPTTFFPRPVPDDLRAALGLAGNHTVLFYHGNVHAANRAEVRELYLAVARLNAEGHPATLLRCGRDAVALDVESAHVIALGEIRNHHIGPLMALADFLVQPGEADAFNDYRFPSKLPEFFALGRPVILPLTNLGHVVRDGEDACVLKKADAQGIADAVQRLRGDPALCARLSAGAVAFSEQRFSWQHSAKTLLNFYLQLPAGSMSGVPSLHADPSRESA